MKPTGVLIGGLLALILIVLVIVVGVSVFVVRLSTPPPATVVAALPPGLVQCPDKNGIYAESIASCDLVRETNTGDADEPAAQPTSPPPAPTAEPTQPPQPPPTAQPTTAPPPRIVNIIDGRYDAGTADVALSADQAIIGQSYEVNGQGGGCQVFGGNGPANVSIVDGEWWIFDTTLSDDDLQRLMGVARQNQQNDPQAQCDGGSTITRI